MSPSHAGTGSPGTEAMAVLALLVAPPAKASQNAQADTLLLHPWGEDLPDQSLLGLTPIVSATHTHTHTPHSTARRTSSLGRSLNSQCLHTQSWCPGNILRFRVTREKELSDLNSCGLAAGLPLVLSWMKGWFWAWPGDAQEKKWALHRAVQWVMTGSPSVGTWDGCADALALFYLLFRKELTLRSWTP